ncbi:MAG: DUF4236 domain-containing protein [Paludibacteraceae bacterium]|nr:DUF4236 domain-containing protein [Paludibacteraceae bacterium]
MGINYRKRISLGPGVKLNISKNGVSTTIGPKGGNVNIGKNGIYVNSSIPGSGLYARQKVSSSKSSSSTPDDAGMTIYEWVMIILLVFSTLLFTFCVLFPHFEMLPIVLISAVIAQIVYWTMWILLDDGDRQKN